MSRAGQASAFVGEDELLDALESVADWIPVRRAVDASRPEQQSQAWATYANGLEARLDDLCEQLAAANAARAAQLVVCRDTDRAPTAAGGAADRAGQERLVLLARLRAEQLMCVRLLKLLARCERLEVLADSEGEAAAVLDARRRRELRQRDFEDSLSEQLALSQACLDAVARARESERATRLRQLPHWSDAG